MRDVYWSRSISLAIPILLVMYGAWFWPGADTAYWTFLLLATFFFGHIHNLISFRYQTRAIWRRRQPRELVWFTVLTLVSAATVYIGISLGYQALLVPLVFIVFFAHSYLDEQTLLKMQAGITNLPTSFFLFLTFLPMVLIYQSLTHPSFFFTNSLEFYEPVKPPLEVIIGELGFDPHYLMLVSALIGFTFLAVAWRGLAAYRWLRAASVGLFLLILTIALRFEPVHYLYIFHISFSYHYILWSIVYYQKLKNEAPQRLPGYIREHLYLAVPLGLLILGFYFAVDSWVHTLSEWVYHTAIFFTIAFTHTVISFMNDDWFRKYVLRL
jgi:hypothetical protein